MRSCECGADIGDGMTVCPKCQKRVGESGREIYDAVADKVGLVPNIRVKDNVVQGAVCAGTGGLGMLAGGLAGGSWTSAGLGLAAGMFIGLVVSGGVLMIIGLIRK